MRAQPIEQRVQLVRILLASLLDYLPAPLTASGLIARTAPPGPAPGRRVPCDYCRRAGRVRVVRGSRICPVCDGSGWRTRRGPRDKPTHPAYEEPWDEYTEQPVAGAAQHPPAMSSHLIDRTLERIERAQALREGDDSSERFGWERERIVYDRKGSYNELRRALRVLHRKWPPGYLQVRRVYLRGLAFEETNDDRLYLQAAEEWLARLMRGPIRVPPWLQEHSTETRQRSVDELAAEGLAAGQIARVLRLPKQKVRRLLSERAARFSMVAEMTAAPGGAERVRDEPGLLRGGACPWG
jgi:hypothetical protein